MSLRKNTISRMMLSTELDAEFASGLPILEVAGTNRILIENHQSVTSYSSDSIRVEVKYGCICISGSGLTIIKMTKEQLVICGNIQSIHLITGGK